MAPNVRHDATCFLTSLLLCSNNLCLFLNQAIFPITHLCYVFFILLLGEKADQTPEMCKKKK